MLRASKKCIYADNLCFNFVYTALINDMVCGVPFP